MTTARQKITPCLWFDTQAEEAVNHYISIFRDGKINSLARYGDAGPGPKGSVLTIAFELAGRQFIALNGGPVFKFTEAISLAIDCQSQPEVDELWERLSDGGSKGQCGWLKDKYGLSWQVVPSVLIDMLQDPDPVKNARLMTATFKMQKLDIAALKAAYDG
jgi:predicted 3-demethylubiquinone-9 3-methyltransferase (glyoxalase superfamily)